MTPQILAELLPPQGLFREPGIPWRVSPEPLALPRALVRQLEGLGHVLARFQDAAHELYLSSVAGREAPWLAPMLEAGKPEWLVQAQRRSSGAKAASVIRPDLLWCDDGLALAELDSVPGGMGLTLFLSRAYSRAGYEILGGAEGLAEGFRSAHPDGALIAVSKESSDYRPEMEYLAEALGAGYDCVDAEGLPEALPPGTCLYRFFELFDTEAIAPARALLEASSRGAFRMSPPAIQHQEEKAWLALFHYPGLQRYWERSLRASQLSRLRRLIPRGWVADPTPLPPQAALPGLDLHDWQQVAELGRKARRLVLKISGFDERAWGGRGVFIGHDLSTEDWAAALHRALSDFPERLWLLQQFREPRVIEHPVCEPGGGVAMMRGRVRLCPYYFRSAGGSTSLAGCLATIVPEDKKKIHGMREAILVPCQKS